MFKWLTRNDGRRRAKAGRRLGSPRGAVFSEFALIMPIALLACSALIELAGFWDAGIMANHTAWLVGRIAMVRGADGMAFGPSDSTAVNSIGFPNRPMPSGLATALKGIDSQHAASLADRGKITAMFMMSTCGIGYFGGATTGASADNFVSLASKATKTIWKGYETQFAGSVSQLKTNIVNAISTDIANAVIPGGATSILGSFAKSIISKITNWATDKLLEKPIEKLAGTFTTAVKTLAAAGDVQPFNLVFSSTGERLQISRQLRGAARRAASANCRVVVSETASGNSGTADRFVFHGTNSLRHPLVSDGRVKHDGYAVTNAPGWPPQGKAHRLLRIDVEWPYEAGWLFPVVSGYGSTSAATAKGRSMVFPQPNIMPRQLYSAGAEPFAGADYTPAEDSPLEDLSAEITNYLAAAKFCLQFRICEENLTWSVGKCPYCSISWSYCPQLMNAFGLRNPSRHAEWSTNHVPCSQGDYLLSWNNLTEGAAQRIRGTKSWKGFDGDTGYQNTNQLAAHFQPESYHTRDYFHWDGSYHNSYQWPLCKERGKIRFDWPSGPFGEWMGPYGYRDEDTVVQTAANNKDEFQALYDKYATSLTISDPGGGVVITPAAGRTAGTQGAVTAGFLGGGGSTPVINPSPGNPGGGGITIPVINPSPGNPGGGGSIIISAPDCNTLRTKIIAKAKSIKVNIPNLCKLQGSYEQWKADDQELEALTKEVHRKFTNIVALVESEIKEIDNLASNKLDDVEFTTLDLFDPDSLDAIQNPTETADQAREKWEETKAKLRACLKELDELAVKVRRIYSGYSEDGEVKQESLNRRFSDFWDTWGFSSDHSLAPGGRRAAGVYNGFPVACIKLACKYGLGILDDSQAGVFCGAFKTTWTDESGGILGYPIALRTKEMLDVFREYDELLAAAWEKEKEYGTLLGLQTASKFPMPSNGMAMEDTVTEAGKVTEPEASGTLKAGNDFGTPLIDNDKQVFQDVKDGWVWK